MVSTDFWLPGTPSSLSGLGSALEGKLDMENMTSWTRMLGISLRPFTGHSPLSLIVRGAIQAAVNVFFLVIGIKMQGTLNEVSAVDAGAKQPSGWVIVFGFVVVMLLIYGLAKIVVGVLDLVPHSTFPGTVVSISERQFLDFLPDVVNNALWDSDNNTGQSWTEKRSVRHEVVVDTGAGTKAWTVRNPKKVRALAPGRRITPTVSPIVGYAKKIE